MNNNNIYSSTYRIRYSEFDCNLLLKPSSLLQLLQDVASENAESLGFGYSFLVKKNLAWFLLKSHMEFENYPKEVYLVGNALTNSDLLENIKSAYFVGKNL